MLGAEFLSALGAIERARFDPCRVCEIMPYKLSVQAVWNGIKHCGHEDMYWGLLTDSKRQDGTRKYDFIAYDKLTILENLS